jgi:hypothetical protein
MNGFRSLALASVAVVCVACADPRESVNGSGPTTLGPTVEQDGTVYTPASQSNEGCLLYRVRISGGQASAALAYRSEDGSFSYARPDQCVRLESER